MSPRNPPQAIVDLLLRTSCRRIASISPNHAALLDDVQRLMGDSGTGLTIFEIPSISEIYPHLGNESLSTPFTGFPKPIAQNHRGQLSWLNAPLLWQYRNYPSVRLGVMALPPFHIFGVAAQLYAMLIGVTATLYAPTSVRDRRTLPPIPTSDNMIECIRQTGTNIVLCVPYHLEQWADSEEALKVLQKVGYVVYGGGPLSEKKGDFLTAAGIPLAQLYGATECGPVSILPPRDSVINGNPYWQWVEFSDTVNIRWAPHDLDLYECQVLRSDKLQPSIENLPDVQGYATNDLFVRHPTKKELWKIVSRADDVIVLSSGEKTVPSHMETIIGCCPYVNGAVMPYVEDANASMPTYSRIFKEMILIARRDKPVSRTMKGTIQRKAALQAYEHEINALYDVVGLSHEVGDNTFPSQWTEGELESWLLSQAGNVKTDLNPIVDLFAQGFDSLSATYLRNRLISALRRSSEPGMQKISSLITQTLSSRTPLSSHWQRRPAKRVRLDGGRVVLLTGSTGTLGNPICSLILLGTGQRSRQSMFSIDFRRLQEHTAVCVNSKHSRRERLIYATPNSSRKISYLEGDISQDKLGLAAPTYERLKYSVTMIIHQCMALCQGPVPEDLIGDPAMAIGSGYGASKHVAEQIITRSGLQATSLRIGQIAGGPTGAWATTDWVPILVKSSLVLGSLPDLPGVVSWTPADRVAAAALDVALSETHVPLVNVTHPRPVQWRTIFEGVRDALSASGQTKHALPLEPYPEWIQKLERRAHGAKERDFNELVSCSLRMLKSFLEDGEAGNGLRFATDKACSLSNTMHLLATRECEWVGPSHAQAWVKYWKSKGFLQ
ncbi:putative nonribosomal peptide synthetase [Suillus ampliporus]|nr:putative nonribosomal peptide synthetase [Suillus ampliporus]